MFVCTMYVCMYACMHGSMYVLTACSDLTDSNDSLLTACMTGRRGRGRSRMVLLNVLPYSYLISLDSTSPVTASVTDSISRTAQVDSHVRPQHTAHRLAAHIGAYYTYCTDVGYLGLAV